MHALTVSKIETDHIKIINRHRQFVHDILWNATILNHSDLIFELYFRTNPLLNLSLWGLCTIQQDFTSIDSSKMYSYVIQHTHDVKRINIYIIHTYMLCIYTNTWHVVTHSVAILCGSLLSVQFVSSIITLNYHCRHMYLVCG